MKIYHETNDFLEKCFNLLETPAPAPVAIKVNDGYVLRYNKEHQSLELAIVQKLARYISGLNASLLLLEAGYTQEVGVIFRTLDEFGEDIVFLAFPVLGIIEKTPTHDEYLQDFFQDELDNLSNAFRSTQKRRSVSRKKIRAVIADANKNGLNPHDSRELSRTLSQLFSGFVHGASGHILEMVGGEPLRYYLSGMAGTYRQSELMSEYWNYAYRGLVSAVFTANALGDYDVIDDVRKFIAHFERVTGDKGSGNAEELMQKVKRKGS